MEQQAQHLTELLTVTNDMGKIDNFRPDPNDVSNVVIEGTDTAHLIRECVLCHKKVFHNKPFEYRKRNSFKS